MEQGADINPEELLVFAQRAVSIDPYREGSHRHLLRALALMGRRSDALTLYREIEQRLRRDLGVEPEAATREVLEAVRSVAWKSVVLGQSVSFLLHLVDALLFYK